MLVSSSFMISVEAADGDLDPTFGTGGKVTTSFTDAFGEIRSVAVQSDGKIVVAGEVVDSNFASDFALARYNADGSLDDGSANDITPVDSFGTGGKVTTDFFGGNDGANGLALQTDGKIVVTGYAINGDNSNFALARYNADGSLDDGAAADITPGDSFGTTGKVTTDFSVSIFTFPAVAFDVALQSDGKIVAAGKAMGGGAPTSSLDFALARYNADGTPDVMFGINGRLTLDFFSHFDETASALALQSDGKIVVAGNILNGANYDFALARFNADGSLDDGANSDTTPGDSFGSAGFLVGGRITTDFFGGEDGALDVALQSDGKVVAAGYASVSGSSDFALARYNSDGSLDDGTATDVTAGDSFGSGGKVTTDFTNPFERGHAVVIQCDGKIVVGGVTAGFSGVDFALARYEINGAVNPTFGGSGKLTTDFAGPAAALDLALQSDGRVVAAGNAGLDFAVARYDSETCAAAPCPHPHGHWKNNPDTWPVFSLTLGAQSYSEAELLTLLNGPTLKDASLILARQLIAAKLNLENGSDPAPVSNVIVDADTLLSGYGGKLPYKVKPQLAAGQAMIGDAGALENYNQGLLTPGCAP